jgi:hypothetical protein
MKRILLITAALLVGGLALWRAGIEAIRLRGESARLQDQILAASNRLAGAQSDAESRRQEIASKTADSESVLSELAAVVRRRSQDLLSAEHAYTQPPKELPAWTPGSPYIWLEKPLLKRLSLDVFQPDGSLTPTAVEILGLEAAEAGKLAGSLKRTIAQHLHQETSRARVVQEHLPEIAREKGPKLTLRIDPTQETSNGLRNEFEATLAEQLGAQRMGLLKSSIERGLSELFREQPNEAWTLSFVLLPSGVFSRAEQREGGTSIWIGFRDIRPMVPEHLLHLIPPEFIPKSDEPAEP